MRLFVIGLLTLSLMSCGNDKKQGDASSIPEETAADIVVGDTTVILPLAVGNRWTYDVSQFDTVAGEFIPFRVDTFEVTRDTVIEDEVWYIVEGMIPEGGRTINREGGLWQYRPDTDTFLFLKYPAEVGVEYVTKIGPSNVMNRVVGNDVRLTVPAGTFTCYKYSQLIQHPGITVDFYFQPGVGGVRMSVLAGNGLTPISRHDLIEYELK